MNGPGKITQKDIARELGVSVSLVSRVLSGQGKKIGISSEMIKAVEELARENHYVPAAAALALNGKKTRTIGIVVYDFHDPFFSEVIAALQKIAHEFDYSLLLVGFVNRNPQDSDLAPLYKHFVDSIIVLGSYGDLDWLDNFKGTPIVRIGKGEDPRITFAVNVDETDAALQIVRHLKSLGRRKFCYVARNISVHEARRKATMEAAAAEGCEVIQVEKKGDTDFDVACAAADSIAASGDADAFVCSTDVAAMGVIKRLSELGKKVPEDFAVVGFDDISSASFYIPSITTLRQPVDQFVASAMRFLTKGGRERTVSHKGQLIVRASTTAAAANILTPRNPPSQTKHGLI